MTEYQMEIKMEGAHEKFQSAYLSFISSFSQNKLQQQGNNGA